MATLVLTVAGNLIAGPIGGAIGAFIGQRIDQEVLFKPKGRQGPRLGDLAIQTSAYGNAIPKLFGMMRVAGTVIWATDLVEHKTRSGGKGRPRTTTYSYSASFAVALSARPIIGVRRIWADGNLLRGAAGDFKTETGFRLHPGSEDQAVDPLIAAAEGIGQTPAYRGIAYAVFENFQLADYGNRIPSLTFEVEADSAPVPISTIAAALSYGAVGGSAGRTLGGYAASGDSVRGAIETLARAAPLSIADMGDGLVLASGNEPAAVIAAREAGASSGAAGGTRRDERRGSALIVPGEISLAYYEPVRDYQAGLHRARRPGAGRRGERIELPAALSAQEAKAIAEANLERQWTERARRTLHLPWRALRLSPARIIGIEGETGLWRVAEWTLERMVLSLSLVRFRGGTMPPSQAEPGRSAGPDDHVHGPTTLHVFELPELGEALTTAPRLYVAAAGASAGWRGAALSASFDGGASWLDMGRTAAPAVMGSVAAPPGTGTSLLFDDISAIEVVLLNDAMALQDADDARLAAGANLALIGGELIQFGRAEPLGARRYRLSHLLRGRRGTEFAMAAHAAGERFILLEHETVLGIDIPASVLGSAVSVMASGVGDGVAATGSAPIAGLSVRPPAPVGLRAIPLGDGGYRVGWTRRSRLGWRWLDAVDAPLGEEREAYRLSISRGDAVVRTVECAEPFFSYDAAMVAADRGGGDALSLSLVQIGAIAQSLPETIILTLS